MSEQFASNDAQSTETPDSAEGVVPGTPDDVETTDAAAAEVLTQTDPASDSPYAVHTTPMPETDDSDVVAVGDEIDALDELAQRRLGWSSLIVDGRYLVKGDSYESYLDNARKIIDAVAASRKPVANAPTKPRS